MLWGLFIPSLLAILIAHRVAWDLGRKHGQPPRVPSVNWAALLPEDREWVSAQLRLAGIEAPKGWR